MRLNTVGKVLKMSPLACKTKSNHQTGKNVRKGNLEIIPNKKIFLKLPQPNPKKVALRVKKSPPRQMNQVKGVKELSGLRLNSKQIINFVFTLSKIAASKSYTFYSLHSYPCFCFFHKHLLNGQKKFISNLDIQP